MQPLIPFDSLSEEEQTQVLKYIEATNTETVDDAIRVLLHHNMKADDALRTNHNSQMDQSYTSFYTSEQEEEIAGYASFLRQEALKRVTCAACFRGCGKAVKRIFKRISNFPLIKYPNAFKGYSGKTLLMRYIKVTHKSIYFKEIYKKLIPKVKYSKNQQLYSLVSHFQKRLGRFFTVNKHPLFWFISLGITQSKTNDIADLFEDMTQPCLVFIYMSIFNKVCVLGKYGIQHVNKSILEKVVEQYKLQRRHQKNIIIRYNNKIMMTYFQNDAENYLEDQLPQNNEIYESHIIRQQQTRQYQQASNTRLKQQKEQEENKKKIDEMLIQRSIRKTSISQEPSHENIVTLNFRCPAGNKLKRKFGLDQIVDNIYTWVQTNDEIQFEEDPIRNFDLLRGYPPESIASLKQKTIEEAFQDKYQLITIKEI